MCSEIVIGDLVLKNRAFLAPMASLTDIALRRCLDEEGSVGLMVSELISVEGLRRMNCRTLEMIRSFEFRTPQFIQLFGTDPDSFGESAEYIANETAFAGIDINAGCPAKKVVRKGAGSALLSNHEGLADIVRAVRKKSHLPLTVKIRLGYDKLNVLETVKMLSDEGVDAVTVHFRMKDTRYSEPSDWEYADKIGEVINTVYIGNGDICTVEDANRRMQSVDAVMIGRGAVINPMIFAEILGRKVGREDYRKLLLRLVDLVDMYYEGPAKLAQIKAYTRFFASQRKDVKRFRKAIYGASTFKEAAGYFGDMY